MGARANEGESWYAMDSKDVLSRVGSAETGLTAREAEKRLADYGPNELKEGARIGPLTIILGQFKSLIIWILIAAGIISGALGETLDAFAILAIVVLNAAIGFYQEYSAEKSIAALRKMTAPKATALRDGELVSIPASGLVVGDILALEAGDLVASDARLLEAASLSCVEAALTGESEAVVKLPETLEGNEVPLGDRANMVFMGTGIATGTGRAVVVATSMDTELGKIAGLIEEATGDEDTPLQKKLDSFGRILVWAALGIVALLFALGLLRGTKLFDLIMTSISLAVAAVPEGLPAVVTVALSIGVSRMARRRALVRRLPAVETLGSTTVICTDKTGTLTVGEMTVRALYVAGVSYEVTGEGYGPGGEVRRLDEADVATVDAREVAGAKARTETSEAAPHEAASPEAASPEAASREAASREAASPGVAQNPSGDGSPLTELATALLCCNNAHLVEEDGMWKVIGDPTEGALLAAGRKAGGDREGLEKELPKHHELPFDSDRKRGTVIRRTPEGHLRAFTNGAPDVLLGLCAFILSDTGVRSITEEDRADISARNAAMAKRALRVLGSARRDLDMPASAEDRSELTVEAVEREMVFIGLSGMYDPPREEAREAVAQCRAAGIRVVMITGDHPRTATAIAAQIGIATERDEAITGIELDRLSDGELERRVPEIAVYARVSAAHKLRIVRAWKANDAVVAMTGDGVNDAPALKGADIGIAMGRGGTEVTRQAADMIVTDDNFASIVAAVEEGRGIYDNIRKTLQYLLAGNAGELMLMMVCVVVGLPAPLLPIHLLWINLVTDGLPSLCLATDPIDPDVMKRLPRMRSGSITDPGFLRTMTLTGFLTAGAAFCVYLYVLSAGTPELARSCSFTVLVFAELLRSFGARSETKALWRIPFFANLNLVIVVCASIGLQVLSQHNSALGGFLKTSPIPIGTGLMLLAIGAIPMVILEVVKALSGLRKNRREDEA